MAVYEWLSGTFCQYSGQGGKYGRSPGHGFDSGVAFVGMGGMTRYEECCKMGALWEFVSFVFILQFVTTAQRRRHRVGNKEMILDHALSRSL